MPTSPTYVVITSGPGASRVRVLSVHGEPVRTTSRDVLKLTGFTESAETDLDVLLAQIDQFEPQAARERALGLLGYRERSTQELRVKLLADGYPPDLVAGIVKTYVDLELLDDSRFAGMYVRTKRAAGWGSRRIAHGLRQAGVDDLIAEDALRDGSEGEAEFDRALRLARSRPPRDRADVERVMARLARRGFTFDVARSASLQAFEEVMRGDTGP